jgi:polysaccharide chain length determinant protein (PEP-CTERM system associated)
LQRSLIEIIRLLLYAAWRRRYLICVPIVMMIPIGIIGSRFAPKVYEAKTILLLQETGKDNPFLKDYAVGLHVKDRISALQALLKSEHVLRAVLSDIHGADIEKDQRKLAMMMRQLGTDISVQLVGSDLLELKLKGSQPQGLGKLLSAISKRFLERLLSPEQSTLGATQEFLKQQKEMRRSALEEAELEFARFKAQNSDKLPAIYTTNVQRLGAMRQKLEEKTMELSAANASFGDMRRQLARTNPIVGRLEESIVQVTSELTALRSRYTDSHSDVQAAERKLQRLEEERRTYIEDAKRIDQLDVERLWNLAAGQHNKDDKAPPPLLVSQLLRLQEAQAKRVALQNDVDQLKAAVDDLQRVMAQYAPIEQQQGRLEKEVQSARDLYDQFMKRYDNASTSRALGVFEAPERIKVIDAPQDPTIPTTLPKFVFAIAGIFAGIALGIGLAVAAEMLDQRVRTTGDFTDLARVPVIARLPRLRDTQQPAVAAT